MTAGGHGDRRWVTKSILGRTDGGYGARDHASSTPRDGAGCASLRRRFWPGRAMKKGVAAGLGAVVTLGVYLHWVRPWLVQWGWNRAGFYSYDLLQQRQPSGSRWRFTI